MLEYHAFDQEKRTATLILKLKIEKLTRSKSLESKVPSELKRLLLLSCKVGVRCKRSYED